MSILLILEEPNKISPFAQLLSKAREENENAQTEKVVEDKFNNTNVYNQGTSNDMYNMDDYATNKSKEKDDFLEDDDIKEEILVEALIMEKDENKDKSGSNHNYTSSQTYGMDNSVTSYNLDFYDHVEAVKKA